MKKAISIIFILAIYSLISQGLHAQNTMGESDDYSRIAIAPTILEESAKLPMGSANVLKGKMRQIISLNGLSAADDAPLFIMYPEIMILSNDVSPTSPPMQTLDIEVVFNLADKYTGNIYASSTEALKGVGQSETAAYNAAFKQINVRSGKYKVMLEKGKEGILEYYNTHCDLVISRAKSLASQKRYNDALALLNSVPPVSRECFDEANEVAAEIGENMPEQVSPVAIADAKEPEDSSPVYPYTQSIDLGDNIFLKYKYGKNIGEKTFLYFELINKNEGDYVFNMNHIRSTMLINEKGGEVYIKLMKIGTQEGRNWINATLIPDVNTELVCEFPKVKEVKYIRFNINNNQFKFKNLPINN